MRSTQREPLPRPRDPALEPPYAVSVPGIWYQAPRRYWRSTHARPVPSFSSRTGVADTLQHLLKGHAGLDCWRRVAVEHELGHTGHVGGHAGHVGGHGVRARGQGAEGGGGDGGNEVGGGGRVLVVKHARFVELRAPARVAPRIHDGKVAMSPGAGEPVSVPDIAKRLRRTIAEKAAVYSLLVTGEPLMHVARLGGCRTSRRGGVPGGGGY
eukprot:394524-Rhodomonas_salina.2